MDRGAWQAMVHRVTKSRTQLSNYAQHTAPFSRGLPFSDFPESSGFHEHSPGEIYQYQYLHFFSHISGHVIGYFP